MPTDWDIIRAQDAEDRGENYYPPDVRMRMHIAGKLEAARAEAITARATFEASPEGELAKLQSELRILACSMPAEAWRQMHEGQGHPAPAQPGTADLSIAEQAKVLEIRLAAAFKETE